MNDERIHVETLLTQYQRNLYILEAQLALHGGFASAPLWLLNGVYETRNQIAKLESRLDRPSTKSSESSFVLQERPATNKVQAVIVSATEDQQWSAEVATSLHNDGLEIWNMLWHAQPGEPLQDQIEQAMLNSFACAIFFDTHSLDGWQYELMRLAIQRRVEMAPRYRVIPVLSSNDTARA